MMVARLHKNPVMLLRLSTSVMPTCCMIWMLLCIAVATIGTNSVVTKAQTTIVADPDLPLGDINILVVTDTHSWCGGQKKLYGDTSAANYGDILSFVQRMKQYIYDNEQQQRDLWFVMNGDFIDGTGLSMNRNVDALIPILERMQYDAINVGNHELYYDHFIEQITSPGGFVDWYGEKYISTNVRFNTTGVGTTSTGTVQFQQQQDDEDKPIGNLYFTLKGKYYNVLTFGFLYNMKNYASSVMVVEVETIVQESWFIDVIQKSDQYDAILILAHMDVHDPLCQIILDAIREITGHGNVPVQFITGHTHIRDYHVFDPLSTSFEAGHFLDTLGFVSFPSIKTIRNSTSQIGTNESTTNGTSASPTTSLFRYKYIDADIRTLATTLGIAIETLPTVDGAEQSHFITRIQNELGLNEVIGCSDNTYYLNRTLDAEDSLWGHFRDYVVPSRFHGNNMVLFLGNGGWRYDLYRGTVSVDDVYGISPFNNTFSSWNNVPAMVIVALNNTLNALPSQFPSPLPNFILMPTEPSFYSSNENYTLIVDSYIVSMIEDALRDIIIPEYASDLPIREELPSGMTTTSVWMYYFQENSHNCQNSIHITPTNHKSSKPSSAHNNNASQHDDGPSTDTLRLLFVAIAVVVVVILSGIIVSQKSTIFHYIMEQRDRATMEAIREYEEREEDNVVVDDDSGEEGEFT